MSEDKRDELLSEIRSFIEEFNFNGNKYAPGEVILSKRTVFEIYLNDVFKDLKDLTRQDKEYLFKEIVKMEVLFPIPYTTNNFKKVHYFANVIRNVANIIFRDVEEKEIKIDIVSNEPVFKDFFLYIRSNNEEGAFLYRNSVFDIDSEILEETKIEKEQATILRGRFTSPYVKMNVAPVTSNLSIVKLPIRETTATE